MYEVDPQGRYGNATDGLSFAQDYERLIDDLLANPLGERDPRQRSNMPPEPYRAPKEVAESKEKLRRHALIMVEPNRSKWEWLYLNLSDAMSRRLLLLVLAYRAIGWKYVRLPLDNELFWGTVTELTKLGMTADVPDNIAKRGLQRFDLSPLGRDVRLYTDPFGVFNEFLYSQYAYRGMTDIIRPEPGDYVMDCGACFGGTSLSFADLVGPRGRVFSFEFFPANVDTYRQNLFMNINLANRISLVQNPVMSVSNAVMSITGAGPAAQVHFQDIEGAQKVQSVTIDDFTQNSNLPRVDFIKMDIEGAEIEALKGAMHTIERFRPKMAVSVYHDLTHFHEVPRLLKGIHPDYRLFFGHSTAHGDESVIFAA